MFEASLANLDMPSFGGVLTTTVFLPAVAALAIALLLRHRDHIRALALLVVLADLVLAIYVMVRYDIAKGGYQLVDFIDWIPGDTLNASYHLGVDGLSAPLVLLTALIGLCAILASWRVEHRMREYFVWLLVLQTAVMGVFTSLDFLLFFLFWEMELLPMYLLISIWGTGRKEYSAMKFLVFTILGSAFMLVSIVAIFVAPGGTFNIAELAEAGVGHLDLAIPTALAFWFFLVAFAIKLPVWPVHTWLPDAHTDAPTAVSMVLAGVLLKMGGYGFIRICVGLFPEQANYYAPVLVALAVMSVLYGAVVTIRQTDLKRLIAYSSVSHMGLVLLGVASVHVLSDGSLSSVGLTGASLQMFTHGTITGLLFLLVGLVYEKTHTRYIPDMGGLAGRMPLLAGAFLLAGLASLGLPGLSGFVSELLVFLGGFKVFAWPTALAVIGILLAAGYILWMLERVFFGRPKDYLAEVKDVDWVEAVPIALLVASIVVVGIYPKLLTDVFEAGVQPIITLVSQQT